MPPRISGQYWNNALGLAVAASLFVFAANARADVTISSSATENMICAGGVCAPTASDAVLNVGDLKTLLASGNIEVTSTGTGVQADNIIVEAPFSWSSANGLTFDAARSVRINTGVRATGVGGVTVKTNDGGTDGTFSFGTNGHFVFENLRSRLLIDGTRYKLVNTIRGLATQIGKNRSGSFALARNYDAARDGIYSASPIATVFSGNLDGLGNTISNLTINDPVSGADVGLFNELGQGGTITNLGLTNVNISGADYAQVGGLVVTSYGALFGDFVTGNLSVGEFGAAGGLVESSLDGQGSTGAIIDDSHAYVHMSAGYNAGDAAIVIMNAGVVENTFASGSTMGSGLVGTNTGLVEYSSSSVDSGSGLVGFNDGGEIIASHATGTELGAGLVGENGYGGLILDCYATGAVIGGGGGLAAANVYGSAIIDSYATGNVSGGKSSINGGLVGDNDYGSSILNSYATGNVAGGLSSSNGGLVGFNRESVVAESFAWGSASGGESSSNGGLAGFNEAGLIENSYAKGAIAGGHSSNNGGLVGDNEEGGNIMNSYAIGIVAGTSVASINGGLVRLNGNGGSLISDSYATGSVADTGSAGVDGGLVGENAGGIVNSYATGAVKGSSNEGGLVGINGGTISDAYSTGSVSGKGFVGGLIGDDASPSGSITDAYWDTTTSSITNLDQGAGNIKDDPGIVGLTSKQLRSGLPQGFDSSVWTEKHRINSGFPYLLALPPGTKMSPAPLPAGLSSLQFSLSGAASSPDNDVWHRLAKFHQN